MIMPYREQLAPWIVVQILPKMQRIIRGRFRHRSDAIGHLTVLQRQIPQSKFIVMFDQLPREQPE